jgi:hypothetical protein
MMLPFCGGFVREETPAAFDGRGGAGLAQMANPGSTYYSMERRGSAGRGVWVSKLEVGMPAYPGLIVKDSYWSWPERSLADNAIDFCVHALGRSFHDTMRRITGT